MLSIRKIAPALVAVLIAACGDRAEVLTDPGLVVLHGATLIDGTGAAPVERSAVVLSGDRILRVGAVGDFKYPDDADVINLDGRFVVPGFIDTHAHVRANMLRPLLAFGITSIRNPAVVPARGVRGVDLRDSIAAGLILGPRMRTAGEVIATAGPFARPTDVLVASQTEVIAEVRAQAAQGVDLIKLYQGMRPDLILSAVEEAHANGLRVMGHLQIAAWSEAIEAGIDGLTHLGSEGPTWELLEPAARGRYARSDWRANLLSWAATAESVDLDGPQVTRLTDALRERRVEVNPTLVVLEALYWGDDSRALAIAEPFPAPPGFASAWAANWQASDGVIGSLSLSPEEWLALKDAFRNAQAMAAHFHRNGVLLTAGSDVGGWLAPGVSFHRELQLLRDAGIDGIDVLRIATLNGAEAMGLEAELGSVEEGKLADLVVLAASPVEDMSNSSLIEAIYLGGVQLTPKELFGN